MSDNNKIFEKLNRVNSEKNEVTFKMEHKGKILHSRKIEIPEYIQSIIDDNDSNFFYFFKDMANQFEDMLNTMHKKKMWDELKDKDGDEGRKK